MPTPLQTWILAARPKTLWAAAAPVMMGAAMARADGVFHTWAAVAALAGALLIQVGTNLYNDYADFKKGTDDDSRQGPLRITQAGLAKPQTVRGASIAVFGLSFLCCLYLVTRGGWPILVIGVISILCGFLYTGGPRPLGYVGLGDVFVLVFFGPVAVAGTYYVQAGSGTGWPVAAMIAGVAPGLLSCAILAVNNLRDREGDARAGKRTLAVRFGLGFARAEYVFCIVVAVLCPVVLRVYTGAHSWALLTLLVLPLSIPAVRLVFAHDSGTVLNPVLAKTARLLLVFAVLFSVGWLL